MNATEERWLPVVGWEGAYEVSDRGRLRSMDRILVNQMGIERRWRGRILKLHTHNGYFTIRLPNRSSSVRIHVLVLEAFVGPKPDGLEACHNNGDSYDNRLENLRYDTHANNLLDKIRHGTAINQNVGKTHCIRGHEFTPENTYIYSKLGERGCRICRTAAADRSRKQRRKQQTKDNNYESSTSVPAHP